MRKALGALTARLTANDMARGIGAIFATRMLGAAIGLFSSIIISRSLGPDGRGIFTTASTLTAVGVQIAILGLQSSNTYFLAGDRSLLKPILANTLVVSFAVGGLVGFVIAIFLLLSGLQGIGLSAIGWALLTIPVSTASMLCVNLFLPMRQVGLFNAFDLAQKLLTLMALAIVALIGLASPDMFLMSSFMVFTIVLIVMLPKLGFNGTTLDTASWSRLRQQLPYAFRLYISSFLAFLLVRVDILMLHSIAGNTEVGYYAIAVSVADLIYIFPASAASLLFPHLVAEKSVQNQTRKTWMMMIAVGSCTAMMALAATLLAPWAIPTVFGRAFLPAIDIVPILGGAMVIYGINGVVSSLLAAHGFSWNVIYGWCVGLVANIGLNFALIPLMGGRGAALASLIGYALVLAIQLAQINRLGRASE